MNGEAAGLGDFRPGSSGFYPLSQLLNLGDGNLYGVTPAGSSGYGVLYRIAPGSTSQSAEGVLAPVYRSSSDAGLYQMQGLFSLEPGVIHVFTRSPAGLYRIPLDGSPATVAATFHGSLPGVDQVNSLVPGGDGFLYGTTGAVYNRASDNQQVRGTLFRVAADGTGLTVLHEFQAGEEGLFPTAALTLLPDGFLYGVTADGGTGSGHGVLYRIDRQGQDFAVVCDLAELSGPQGQLLYAPDGFLYGTAPFSGKYGFGGIFRVLPDGSGYKVVYEFKNTSDGGNPYAGLTLGPDGDLYGVASATASGRGGTIFRLRTNFGAPPANHRPVAVDDLLSGLSSGGPAGEVDVTVNDFDPDGDVLRIALATPPQYGAVSLLPGGVLRYTPNRANYPGADAFTYQVSDGRGGVATAIVTVTSLPAPPLVQEGVYSGLLLEDTPDPEEPAAGRPRAEVSLQVMATGKFTGTLFTQRKRVALKGTLDATGAAVLPITLPGKVRGILRLAVQPAATAGVYAAFYGGNTWRGLLAQGIPAGAGEKQTFTLAVSTEIRQHLGAGYASMVVLPSGRITLVGKLGDGSSLSLSTYLTQLPTGAVVIPLFKEPVARGVFGGFLGRSTEQEFSFTGPMRWVRPAAGPAGKPYATGFAATANMQVLRYTAPAPGQPVLRDLEEGIVLFQSELLPQGPAGRFTLAGRQVTVEAPLKSLKFNAATGLYSGVLLHQRKPLPFSGAVLPGLGLGAGLFQLGGYYGVALVGRHGND